MNGVQTYQKADGTVVEVYERTEGEVVVINKATGFVEEAPWGETVPVGWGEEATKDFFRDFEDAHEVLTEEGYREVEGES